MSGAAVVTGASSGIGYALTEILIREGYRVLGVGRNTEKLEELKRKYEPNFTYVTADLREKSSLNVISEAVKHELRKINLLVNNAGYAVGKPILHHSIQQLEDEILVNFVRPLQLVIQLLPHMEPNSIIVNIITAGVHVLLEDFPAYSAAKVGLAYASKILRKELKVKNIKLIEVYPGPVKTRFFCRAGLEPPKLATSPIRVASIIYKAIKGDNNVVYIPKLLRIISIFGPLPFYYKVRK